MANFDKAYVLTRELEAGYWMDPTGGETYRGVARRYHEDFWRDVIDPVLGDTDRYAGNVDDVLDADEAVQDAIKALYRDRYWHKVFGDLIECQTIADYLFDTYVNNGPGKRGGLWSGWRPAILVLQADIGVTVDGIVGTRETLPALNRNYDRDMDNHGWLSVEVAAIVVKMTDAMTEKRVRRVQRDPRHLGTLAGLVARDRYWRRRVVDQMIG